MENKGFILDQTTIKKLLTIYKLAIPDFQRNFVWKQSKKQQLLESLFRGFPIGAITLYDDEDRGYYIIDGLQRINTLNQYLSCPNNVIPFNKYYAKIEDDVKCFVENHSLRISNIQIKSCIRKWYEKLSNLYEFEKVSVLYTVFQKETESIAKNFNNLEIVEELLDILKSRIEIVHDDIALIIYKGDKNDLPELFKNINTGSVPLSQYEILQSVWNDYLLDKEVLTDTFIAFNTELDIIRNDYEIDAVKEEGKFDIFKNIMGLNHIICCKEECDNIFRFSSFRKINGEIGFDGKSKKIYSNDSIAFEIYSTILCGSSNQIVKAVDLIYANGYDNYKISLFVKKLNEIVLEAIDIAIRELKNRKDRVLASKYHSLYIIAGIVFSKYDIEVDKLNIKETTCNYALYNETLKIEEHIIDKWFVDENRQIGFFNIKIKELIDMKKKGVADNSEREKI